MKSCPSCQQVYPDDGPDYCTNDGTPLVRSTSDYGPATAPGGQWQQPPPGYPPPGGYPPYGYGAPYAQAAGGGGLGTAALWLGISTAGCLVFGIILAAVGASSSYTTSYGGGYYTRQPGAAAGFGGLLVLVSFLTGLTAIILGIVAASMSGRNPAISKAKSIVGICLGALPWLILIIGLIAGFSMTNRYR